MRVKPLLEFSCLTDVPQRVVLHVLVVLQIQLLPSLLRLPLLRGLPTISCSIRGLHLRALVQETFP